MREKRGLEWSYTSFSLAYRLDVTSLQPSRQCAVPPTNQKRICAIEAMRAAAHSLMRQCGFTPKHQAEFRLKPLRRKRFEVHARAGSGSESARWGRSSQQTVCKVRKSSLNKFRCVLKFWRGFEEGSDRRARI